MFLLTPPFPSTLGFSLFAFFFKEKRPENCHLFKSSDFVFLPWRRLDTSARNWNKQKIAKDGERARPIFLPPPSPPILVLFVFSDSPFTAFHRVWSSTLKRSWNSNETNPTKISSFLYFFLSTFYPSFVSPRLGSKYETKGFRPVASALKLNFRDMASNKTERERQKRMKECLV